MYCPYCKNQTPEDSNYCIHCASSLRNPFRSAPAPSSANQPNAGTNSRKGNGWLGFVSFLFPSVGLGFFIAWMKTRPRRSKVCGINALVSTILSFFFSFISFFSVITLLEDLSSSTDSSFTHPDFPFYPTFSIPTDDPDTLEDPDVYAKYVDSEDGVLKFTYFSPDAAYAYDEDTNSIIEAKALGVTVYDATTQAIRFEYSYAMEVIKISTYEGKLAVAFGGYAEQINVYDLSTGEFKTYTTWFSVNEIVLTDGALVYASHESWGGVYLVDLDTGTHVSLTDSLTSIYQPAIAINHKEKFVYAVERNLSSCDFFYIDLETKKINSYADFSEYYYSRESVYFDGVHVHAFGYTFQEKEGVMVAGRGYVDPLGDNTMRLYRTLRRTSDYALITTYDCKTVVYSYAQEKIVYTMDLFATEIVEAGEDKFFAVCGDSGYVAFVDLSSL